MKIPFYKFFYSNEVTIFSTSLPDSAMNKTINVNNGNLFDSTRTNVSGFIPVEPETVLYVQLSYNTAFYDKNKQYVTGYATTGGNVRVFQVPKNAAYIRMSVVKEYWNNDFAVFVGTQCFPQYKDDLALDYELETNQRFYRPKLSGKISFVRNDYDWIMEQSFETTYRLYIYKTNDLGVTWEYYYRAKFMRTDLTINVDDKLITVQAETDDEYNDVIAGLEKEYNLIELAPEINDLLITKRPLIQVYIPGDSIVSCFLGGSYWEQDANAVSDLNALTHTYYFAEASILQEITVTLTGTPVGAKGLYTGKVVNDGNQKNATLTQMGGSYYIKYVREPYGNAYLHSYSLYNSAGTRLFGASGVSSEEYLTTQTLINSEGGGSTGTAKLDIFTTRVYMRYLLDVDTILGVTTYPIPNDDIVDNNRNYHRVIGYAFDIAYMSTMFSDTPTQWGRTNDGKYFLPPYSIYGSKFYPIARSRWINVSIWFSFSDMDDLFEKQGRKRYKLKDAFPLSSCIKVILKKFSGITHEATAEYSQFLYGSYRPIGADKTTLMITQKSNILVGSYQQPAQKAPVTLQQITNMLRDCYRCFWYIENGKFKIEQIVWFKNGGSYGSSPVVNYDLTTLTNTRNNKAWGFNTSEYSFDKVNMAERFQFKWMDDVTTAFEGLPIEIKSKYVTPGKIENINIGNFTSDIDMMLLNPGSMSSDGFALFGGVLRDLWPVFADTSGNIYDRGNGIINADGTISYDPNGFGKGWIYVRFNVLPQTRYILKKYDGTQINGVYWQFYTSTLGSLYRSTNTTGNIFTTPTNCEILGISVRIATDANPTSLPVISYNDISTLEEQTLSLPFTTQSVDGVNYYLQNGYLAFTYLQPNYWVYDLPAWKAVINNAEANVFGIERNKKQTFNFPSGNNDPNPMQLIKTFLGLGQVDKLSVNLCSRSVKATLKYNTNESSE